MSNSEDPDEMAYYDLFCMQKPIIISCGSGRVNELVNDKLDNCCSLGIFKYVDSFCCKNVSTHFHNGIKKIPKLYLNILHKVI